MTTSAPPLIALENQHAVGTMPFSGKVDLAGDQIAQTLSIGVENDVKWLAIDLDWSLIWDDEYNAVNTKSFDNFLKKANENKLQVLVSITNAPDWAMGKKGPIPKATAELVFRLTNNYPAIAAVEVFPGANTAAGWGATPDPAAYLDVLAYVSIALNVTGRDIKLIVGGFYPNETYANSINEITFLQALYASGKSHLLDQVSLRYPSGNQQPGEDNSPIISRYEQLRFIMLQQEQQHGKIWITSFTWPSGMKDEHAESAWLAASYATLKSHLYLETIVFDTINPPGMINGNQTSSLIGRNGKLHPGVVSLLAPPRGENTEIITRGVTHD